MSARPICGSLGLRPRVIGGRGFSSTTVLVGVGTPVRPVSDVVGAEATSRQNRRPDGVTQSLQVVLNKVDPRACAFPRNLLSKDDCRSALADEAEERGPEVPLVSKSSALARLAERLARA
jgi:hypothetical protein